MQLKSIGEMTNATTTFNNLIKAGSTGNLILANSLKGLDTQQKINVVSQSVLTKTQKIGVLATSGLTQEELKAAVATDALSGSQKKAATSSLGLSKAMTGLGVTIKPFLASIAAIGALILVYKGIRKATHIDTYENLSNKLEELSERYEENKEKLSEVNSQLEENSKRMQEIASLKKPTYVENEELEKLKQTNSLLERNKALLEKAQNNVKNATTDALYQKYVGEYLTNDAKEAEVINTAGSFTKLFGLFDEEHKKDFTTITGMEYKSLFSTFTDELKDSDGFVDTVDNFCNAVIESVKKTTGIKALKETFADDTFTFSETAARFLGFEKIDEPLTPDVKTDEAIKRLKELREEKEKLLEFDSDNDIANFVVSKNVDAQDKNIEKHIKELEDARADLSSRLMEAYEKDPNSYLVQTLLSQIEEIDKAIDPEQWEKDTFDNFFTSSSNEDTIRELKNKFKESFDTITYEDLIGENVTSQLAKTLYGDESDESLEKAASLLFAKLRETFDKQSDGVTPLLPFKKAFNSTDFKEAKEKLLELATSGELSPKTISSTEEYKKLIDQTGLSAEKLAKKIKEFNIDDKSKNIDYLKGVLSNIESGKTLDTSQASKLISENDSLAGSIEKVGDSYTIEEDALKSLINSNIEQYNIAVSNQNLETQATIKETEKRIKIYKNEIKAIDLLKNKITEKTKAPEGTIKGSLLKGVEMFANTGLSLLQDKIKKSKSSSEKELDELQELLNDLENPLETDKNKKSSSSSSTMDFVEILLDKVSKATEKIQKKFEDAFSLKSAKKNLNKALSQIQKEIKTNASAYTRYMTEANKVGLGKKYIAQIQNGSLNIKDFDSDSEIYDKIQSYQQWYEKAQACKDTIDNLRESEQDLKESYVDKITEYYDRKTKTYQNKIDSTNGLISMNEDIYGYSSSSLYNKAMKNTSKGISAYRRELSTLQKEQKKVNKTTNPSLWYKYQDAIDEAKGSVDDLAESYLSLAKSKAEASITKRDAKVEKLNDTKSLNDSRIDNAVGYGKKNSIVKNNISTEKAILNKYKTAKDESTKAFKTEKKESSKKSFKKALTKSGISKALIEKANTAVKQGKEIPAKVLNALKKNMSGNKNAENAYKQFLEYNTALGIKDSASSDYTKQQQESKTNIKQYQHQLLDNISEDFDLRIKMIQDKQSILDAQWDRIEATGAERTEQYYKNAIQNSTDVKELLQKERNALKQQLEANKWNKNSKEYKEAESQLNNIEIQIQNNTKSQIEWNNTMLNMPIDKLSKTLGVMEAINSANKSITEYYKTVRGYSIESDFKNQISDNSKQIEIQKGLYELYAERAAKAANSGSYLGKTYEEWMQEAQNAKGSLYDMEMENESLKDSLRDEVYLKPFEDMIEYAQRAVDKIKDMESLFSTFDFTLYDDNGNLNEYGLVQMKTSFDKLSKTKTVLSGIVDEMKRLDELYADPNNGMNATEYQEKKIELEDKYNSTLLESANIMKTITDMMKEQAQQQIDAIKEQIEAYKKLLSTEKEENSYQKSMKEKTDTISSLQKRLLALGNGNTEETQAEYQKVLNELETAKDDLEETEWEHYIDLQMQALDDLSESLDDYLSNIDITLESILEALNNAKGIVADVDSSQLLNKLLELVGGDKSIFSGSDTTAPPKQSITKTDLQDWANNKIAELYDTHYSKPEGDRSALQSISELQTLLENNDYDGLLNAYNESQGTEYSLSGTDTSAIENKNARILEDVARIIKEHNIGGMGGMASYFIDNLKQYLSSNNEDDKEEYLKNTSAYIKSGIYYLNTHGGSKEAKNIETYLIQYLKDTINLPGFAHGGIVEQVKRNGDDGIASLKVGEAVITKEQLELLRDSFNELGKFTPVIPDIKKSLQNLTPYTPPLSVPQEYSMGDININLECPAATQEELYSWLQNSRTQKIIQSSVIEPIMGKGTLGRYRH